MNRTTRYLASGALSVLLVAAVGAGLYQLSTNASNIASFRAKALFAFAPAAMFAWLLSRTWPQSATAQQASVPAATLPVAEKPSEDPYTLIGACAPRAAEALLAQLKERQIRFLIDLDEAQPGRWGRGPIARANPVKIFVHQDDLPQTETVLTGLGMKLGTL